MAWLSAEQQAHLVEQAGTGAFFTAMDVPQWIEDRFGVHYRGIVCLRFCSACLLVPAAVMVWTPARLGASPP